MSTNSMFETRTGTLIILCDLYVAGELNPTTFSYLINMLNAHDWGFYNVGEWLFEVGLDLRWSDYYQQ